MTVKNIVFCAALATAVTTAGTTAGAQEPRRNVMVLDGRGGQLGVMVEDTKTGVRIGEVTSGGAAEKAGIKEGDVVVEYDGERVRSARQLTRLVRETADGRAVKIGIERNGQRQTVDATPEAQTFSWNMDIDGDQIRRDFERGMEGFREFRANPPAFNFRYDGEPRDFRFHMDDLMPGMPASRGRLGVSVQSLSDQLADYFGAKDGGALVSSVTEDSAAAKAGIKAGDVITSIDGDKIHDAEALTSEISGKSGEVSIGILRDKKASTVKATIEPRTNQLRTPKRGLTPAAMQKPA
jgi:serine protease Do